MKNYIKLVFIYLLLFACSLNLSMAQNETFPDGRQWIMREYLLNPFAGVNNIIICTVNGDTVLEDYNYKKVYFENKSTGITDVSMLIRRDSTRIYQRYGCYGKWDGDSLVFDESWSIGDKTNWLIDDDIYMTISDISEYQGAKCWNIHDSFIWLKNIGYVKTRMFFSTYSTAMGGYLYDLICCIDPENDTLYVNRDYLYMLETSISSIPAVEFFVRQISGSCIVALSEPVENWTATLYDSSGVTIATQYGGGDEIVLSTASKGTHILTVNVGGKEYVRKILLK